MPWPQTETWFLPTKHALSFKMNENTKLRGSGYTKQHGEHLHKFTDMAQGYLETNSTFLYISPSKLSEKYKLQMLATSPVSSLIF